MRSAGWLAPSLALVVGCSSAPDGPPTTPTTQVPPAAAGDRGRGEQLFAELGCKGCHGGKGEGGGLGPDLFAVPWDDARRTAARATILRGFPDRNPPMPAYQGQVDEPALDDLLAFVAAR